MLSVGQSIFGVRNFRSAFKSDAISVQKCGRDETDCRPDQYMLNPGDSSISGLFQAWVELIIDGAVGCWRVT